MIKSYCGKEKNVNRREEIHLGIKSSESEKKNRDKYILFFFTFYVFSIYNAVFSRLKNEALAAGYIFCSLATLRLNVQKIDRLDRYTHRGK